MNKFKKCLLAAAVSATFGASGTAQAAQAIGFDPLGTFGLNAIPVDVFDWVPGNLIVDNTVPNPAISQLVAQSSLAVLIKPGGINVSPAVGEFTYQLTNMTFGAATGFGSYAWSLVPGLPNYFNIYYDSTPDANSNTGLGYGDNDGNGTIDDGSTLILSGTLATNGTGYIDFTAAGGMPISRLDNFLTDGNNKPGVGTDQGSGGGTMTVDVTFQHWGFFRSMLMGTPMTIDLQNSTASTTPFDQTNPSNQVLGIFPTYGDAAGGFLAVNTPTNAGCTVTAPCDFHMQADASTSFNPASAPGSLALLSLGLGVLGLGGFARRRLV